MKQRAEFSGSAFWPSIVTCWPVLAWWNCSSSGALIAGRGILSESRTAQSRRRRIVAAAFIRGPPDFSFACGKNTIAQSSEATAPFFTGLRFIYVLLDVLRFTFSRLTVSRYVADFEISDNFETRNLKRKT
jgi:hypothetical protein